MIGRRSLLAAASACVCPPTWTQQHTTPSLHVDQHGLIVQTDGNGGDTKAREGWAWFGAALRAQIGKPWEETRGGKTFESVMSQLELGQTGVFRRYPDPPFSEPQDFSRDQTIPLIAAMGARNDTARLSRIWEKTRQRNYTAQNGDAMTPDVISFFDRARNVKPGPIGDLLVVVNVANRVVQAADKDDVGNDLNLIIMLLMAAKRFPFDAEIPGRSTSEALALWRALLKTEAVCKRPGLMARRGAWS